MLLLAQGTLRRRKNTCTLCTRINPRALCAVYVLPVLASAVQAAVAAEPVALATVRTAAGMSQRAHRASAQSLEPPAPGLPVSLFLFPGKARCCSGLLLLTAGLVHKPRQANLARPSCMARATRAHCDPCAAAPEHGHTEPHLAQQSCWTRGCARSSYSAAAASRCASYTSWGTSRGTHTVAASCRFVRNAATSRPTCRAGARLVIVLDVPSPSP
mmetsp:Transcript_14510/g.42308  ORF Transcript_14510/g.42308 Transcript_14510/m.42308 type:complete len:215 (-) Transcript_14510:2002-2646(-)